MSDKKMPPIRFVFKKLMDPNNHFDTSEIVIKSCALTLSEVLEDMEALLVAAGYKFSGNLEIVDDGDDQVGNFDKGEDEI